MGRSQCFYLCEPHPIIGGNAQVHRATGPKGKTYAVKIAVTEKDATLLRQEARTMHWMLDMHPHLREVVVPIVDEGEYELRPFLVLPWQSRRLDRYVVDLGLAARLRLAATLARAVAQLHDCSSTIVHRDIKPSNAFVVEHERGAPRVLLADFGSADRRRREVTDHLTGHHTPGFAPVDQIVPRRSNTLDASWDTYALAVSAFALVAGEPLDGVQQSYRALTLRGAALRRAWKAWSDDPASDVRHEVGRLGRLPLPQLIRLADIQPIRRQDTLLLREQAAAAARRSGRSGRLGVRAAAALLDVLRPSLAPNPSHRQVDAAGLAKQLDRLADWLEGRGRLPRKARPWILGGLVSTGFIVGSGLSLAVYGTPQYGTVVVPSGTAMLGSEPGTWGREDDEVLREVTLTRSIAFGVTEVTQGLWREVMGDLPVQEHRAGVNDQGTSCADYERVSLVADDHPVVCVTWCDAIDFANALSLAQGLAPAYGVQRNGSEGCTVDWDDQAEGWRLPTEAEWAYAARAGGLHPMLAGSMQTTPDRACGELSRFGNVADLSFRTRFPWLDGGTAPAGFFDRACGSDVLDDDGYAVLAPVGRYEPNRFGLHDMTGNVREWVFDVYTATPRPGVDPRGPDEGPTRVFRGSSFDDDTHNVHIANRGHAEPRRRMKYVGVRLARTLPEESR